MTDTDYSTEIAAVVAALNAVFENKEANKKDDLSGDYSSDTASYPTCKSVKAAYGTRVTSWSANPSDSNIPSEALVKTALDGKSGTGHSHATGDITNSATLANIGSNLTNQGAINSALNDVIGVLKGTKFIEIENKPNDPSADTMGKLYIVTESGKVNVYYTKATTSGTTTTYSWQELDANILDDLADATQSVHGLMSAADKTKMDYSKITRISPTSYTAESAGGLNVIVFNGGSTPISNNSLFTMDILGLSSSDITTLETTYGNHSVILYVNNIPLQLGDSSSISGDTRRLTVKEFVNLEAVLIQAVENRGYVFNMASESSGAVNEIKVFAGQLADAIDAINPSSS